MTNVISNFSYFSAIIATVLFTTSQTSFAEDKTVKYDLTGFDKIRIDNVGIEIDVSVGDDFEIEVEGNEMIVDDLMLKVRGDKLVIYRDEEKKVWDKRGNSRLKVEISMPKFTGLDLRGAVDANIDGVDSDEVEFDLKGAGNIEVNGECKWLVVNLKGASNVNAEDLKCEQVDVDLKGVGNIEVYASEEVNAEIKGMGNIDVYGSPEKVSKSDGWFSNISIH